MISFFSISLHLFFFISHVEVKEKTLLPHLQVLNYRANMCYTFLFISAISAAKHTHARQAKATQAYGGDDEKMRNSVQWIGGKHFSRDEDNFPFQRALEQICLRRDSRRQSGKRGAKRICVALVRQRREFHRGVNEIQFKLNFPHSFHPFHLGN